MAEQQPFIVDDQCYAANDFRLMQDGLVCIEGVGSATDLLVTEDSPPSGNVLVSAGHAFIANDNGAGTGGMYHVYNDGPVSLAVPLNSTGGIRTDVVWAQVCDSEYAVVTSGFALIYDTDNPTLTPPADGCTYFMLAQIDVDDGAGTGGTNISATSATFAGLPDEFHMCGDDGGWVTESASLNFPSIAAGGIQTMTMQVDGATVGNPVALGPSSSVPAGLMWSAYVSSTSTVSIRLHNTTGSPIDPAAMTWTASVKIR